MARRSYALLLVPLALAACGGGAEEDGPVDLIVTPGGGGSSGAGTAGAAPHGGTGGAPVGGTGGAGHAGAAGGTAGAAGATSQGGTAGTSSGGAGAGGSVAGAAGTAGGAGGASGGTAGAAGATAGKGGAAGAAPGGCPSLTYPSGVELQLKPNPGLSAIYEKLGVACTTPKCFIDTTDLSSPGGQKHDVHVKLSTHFELYELVSGEVDPKGTGGVDPANAWSTSVLVDVDFMAKLEALRVAYGGPVILTSGFRSPPHQHALCQSICGKDECVQGGVVTCAYNSRHMWGAAADMALKYEAAANAAGFPFVFHENGGTGPHLHVDMKSCK